MPRRMRVAKQRRVPDDRRVRAFLLRATRHDYFDQVRAFGGEVSLRKYWQVHRAALLAEFARTMQSIRPDRLERCGRRPLGSHLFDDRTGGEIGLPERWAP